MNLRPATPADLELIASLHAESWRTAYRGMYPDDYLDNDVIQDRLLVWQDRMRVRADNQGVIVAEGDAMIEGFICVYGDDDRQWGSLIDNLHVAPHLKRGGIGTLLMREGAAWLRDHYPSSGAYLWALEANAPARSFYERLGAREAETVQTETAGGGHAMSCRYVWPAPEALYRACLPLDRA